MKHGDVSFQSDIDDVCSNYTITVYTRINFGLKDKGQVWGDLGHCPPDFPWIPPKMCS